jgi:hypothetical protein
MKKMAEAGTWYGLAFYDPKWAAFPMYGFMSKFSYADSGTAIGRELISMDLGEGKSCSTIRSLINMYNNPRNPRQQQMRAAWTMKGMELVEHGMHVVWTNYRLMVGYKCRKQQRDGTCEAGKGSVFIMSTSEAVDHAEFLLIEQIVRSVCLDPNEMTMLTGHEKCFHQELMDRGNEYYKTKENCDWNAFEGLSCSLDEDCAVGIYHTMAMAERVPSGLSARVYKMEKVGDNKLKAVTKGVRNGVCQSSEIELTRGDDNSLTFNWNINGTETPVAVWLGHRSGPYYVLVGCIGLDCDESTGFAIIESRNRAMDKVALHDVYQWLADHCVHPSLFKFLDTHAECGKEFDTNTCKVSDIKGVGGHDDELFSGIWYLVAHTNSRYSSLKCKVEDGSHENQRKLTCYAKMGGFDPSCKGPSTSTVDYVEDGDHFVYNYSHYTVNMTLLYADTQHLLFYACGLKNSDGSCMRDRTTLMFYSKHASIQRDSMPANMLDRLDSACVDSGQLRFLDETDCGVALQV